MKGLLLFNKLACQLKLQVSENKPAARNICSLQRKNENNFFLPFCVPVPYFFMDLIGVNLIKRALLLEVLS